MAEQPHFDDELTVLTAQPVVPLERIETRIRAKRRWFLGGAFAIAMLLGAASAVLSAYFKLRNAPDPEIQSLSLSSVSEPVLTPPTPEVVSQRPPKVRNTDKKDRQVTEPRPTIDAGLSEDEALKRIRGAVLVDEWQERRARRVERHDERRDRPNSQHRNRNLSNIDEIFEGVRHP